jgi:hypothetical protein
VWIEINQVSMDTYMSSFNSTSFFEALLAYQAAGCSRVAAGLLLSEGGNTADSVAHLFQAVDRAAARHLLYDLAVWVNLWEAPNTLRLWKPYLESFLTDSGAGKV